jgi:hypothetical protein
LSTQSWKRILKSLMQQGACGEVPDRAGAVGAAARVRGTVLTTLGLTGAALDVAIGLTGAALDVAIERLSRDASMSAGGAESDASCVMGAVAIADGGVAAASGAEAREPALLIRTGRIASHRKAAPRPNPTIAQARQRAR